MPIQTVNIEPRSSGGSLYGSSAQMFGNSFGQLAGVAKAYGDRIETRARNAAINELLGAKPTAATTREIGGLTTPVADATADGFRMINQTGEAEAPYAERYTYDQLPTLSQGYAEEVSPAQSALQFQQQQQAGFSGIQGIDPLQALGLAQKQASPYIADEKMQQEQSNADRLFGFNQIKEQNTADYRADSLTQQDRNSQRSFQKGKFTTFDDDNGNVWRLNKNTGDRVKIQGATGIPSKYITTTTKKVGDGFGGYTKTEQRVDSRNGNPLGEPYVIETTYATPTQKDKDFTKNYGQSQPVIGTIRNSFGDTKIWGGLDAVTGPVGKFFNAEEGNRQALVKQDLENLRLEATNKLAGVLSNQDMQIILDTIPTINDQPQVAEAKLAKVEKAISDADANQFNRLAQSNPQLVNDMGQGMMNDPATVPVGYKLQRDTESGRYRLIPQGR